MLEIQYPKNCGMNFLDNMEAKAVQENFERKKLEATERAERLKRLIHKLRAGDVKIQGGIKFLLSNK